MRRPGVSASFAPLLVTWTLRWGRSLHHGLVYGAMMALLAAACTPTARAQALPDTLQPFLTLDTRVSARSLTFQRVGYAEVRLRGVDTARVVSRTNLPRPVQTGVAYRDVRVYARYRIGSPLLEGALRVVLPDTSRSLLPLPNGRRD